jgi:hypothetical protein
MWRYTLHFLTRTGELTVGSIPFTSMNPLLTFSIRLSMIGKRPLSGGKPKCAFIFIIQQVAAPSLSKRKRKLLRGRTHHLPLE